MTHHASVVSERVETRASQKNYAYGNTPRGSVADVVTVNGSPAGIAYRVRLTREADGRLVAEKWSTPGTGAYSFDGLDLDHRYIPVALDHTGTHKPVAAGPLTPVPDA